MVVIWSTVEPAMGIIAASLGTMRPILRAFVHHLRERKSDAPASRLGWLFGRGASTEKRSGYVSNSHQMDETQTHTTIVGLPGSQLATARSFEPLNTVEAPDFLDITNASCDSDEESPRARGFIRYNATPALPPNL
jgi:hypothetical protein